MSSPTATSAQIPAHLVGKHAVLLFHGRGLISALIRWQTRGTYSHAALLMPDGNIIESWPGVGVRITRLKDWEGVDAFSVEGMTQRQWKLAIGFAREEVGAKYDYRAILRFVTRRKMPENRRRFCSEFVHSCLRRAGWPLLARKPDSEISPEALGTSIRLVPE